MKYLSCTLLIVFLGFQTFAQTEDNPPRKETHKKHIVRPTKCPPIYVTTSTGINNNTGLLGFSFDLPLPQSFSIEAGAGLSTWGYKTEVSGKYYLRPCQRGFAVGAGFTYNTGLENYQTTRLETISGTGEKVTLKLHPQTNIFFAAYRYINLGKRYNRFYVEAGWSVPLSGGAKFDQVNGMPLTDNSSNAMRALAPGGLIVGVGFSFAIY